MSGTTFGRDWKLWAPAAVLLGLNLVAFVVFEMLYAGRVEERSTAVERARTVLAETTAERQAAERRLTRVEQNQRRLARLYSKRLQTQEERLTALIAEVKDLAERSGLDPSTIRYPDQLYDNLGLVKRSIVFGVDGTYTALRRLINLLEVTDSFVILEEIRPGGRGSSKGATGRLSIDLEISTYFLDDDVDPEALARSRETVRPDLSGEAS